MTTNPNIGRQAAGTPIPVGADNPGTQACSNCRSTVTPIPTNGISQYSQPNGATPDSGKAASVPTSAGYSCPNCGHSFTWVKSTGVPGGPVDSGNTGFKTAADM